MITSQKGKDMLETVSPIYEQNETMLAIFQSIGLEEEMTTELIDDILLQLYPQTATWGLKFWEEALMIPTNESVSLEARRSRILSKMQTRWPITRGRMEAIINSFITSKNGYINEIFDKYMFKINIPLTDKRIYYKELIETVNEVKPAHLSYTVEGIAGNNTIAIKQLWAHNFINYLMCGTFYPEDNEYWIGRSFNRKVSLESTLYHFEVDYLICGTFYPAGEGVVGKAVNSKVLIESNLYDFNVKYPICGTFNAGEVL